MRKRMFFGVLLLLLACFAMPAGAVSSASVTNVRHQWQNGKLTVTYSLRSDAIVNLRVKCRVNGKSTTRDIYVQGKVENEKVTGDVGYVMAGTDKRIEWNKNEDPAFADIDYVEGVVVMPRNIFQPMKTSILGTFGYSFKPEQWSAGLMMAFTSNKNGWGGFFHFRSNYNFGVKSSYTCDSEGNIDGLSAFYTGETKYLFYMANVGVTYNLLKDKRSRSMLSLGLGAGYGARNVYWQLDDQSWALNKDATNAGVSAELNLIGSIKGFTLMAGVGTINFKYVDLQVGIGITF